MRRRDFLTALGGTALLAKANAQQPRPAIGFLHQGALPPPSLKAAFRKGLVEVGISDGLDIRIEDRAANGEYDQLPALAADLVNRQVTVIAAELLPAALAAKAATQSIPIVFLSGSDPIKSGLVSSITQPTSNVTGIAVMFTRLGAKNLELLRELVPQATVIAALANPINPNAEPQLNDLQVAAKPLGLQLVTLGASNDAELDSVFPTLSQQQVGALIVTADGYLISRQDRLVNLANRFAVPTIYPLRQYAEAGGLISYGANLTDAFRQCGTYVGKILKGAKPADLPVLQPETYELVINLRTAKQLGITVSPNLLGLADDVIE